MSERNEPEIIVNGKSVGRGAEGMLAALLAMSEDCGTLADFLLNGEDES